MHVDLLIKFIHSFIMQVVEFSQKLNMTFLDLITRPTLLRHSTQRLDIWTIFLTLAILI